MLQNNAGANGVKSRHFGTNGSFGKGRQLTHVIQREHSDKETGEGIEPPPKRRLPRGVPDKVAARWEGYKTIVHLDMDAFFAAVEQQHNPALRNKPVIIGGLPGYRGVVSTCSYEARVYGVKSGMPSAEAYRLCPHGIFMQTDGHKYTWVSVEILSLLKQFSPTVEPFSIDEAFIDISGIWQRYGSPADMVNSIKDAIKGKTGLTCSAGIGPNKMIAKMSSGMDKPDGLTEVHPERVPAFLENLPVEAVWGIGKATGKALEKVGIDTVGELAKTDRSLLKRLFGVAGLALHEIANGVGDTEVTPFYQKPNEKSIGHETTLPKDTASVEILTANLRMLSERVGRRMRKSGFEARRVTLKFRYADFSTFTRAKTLSGYIRSDTAIFHQAMRLLKENKQRTDSIRLVGISVSKLRDTYNSFQEDLFRSSGESKLSCICETMDKIKDSYGDNAITYLSTMTRYV
ncbi:MAG: DNA polymerase IV [candidate division Zixibacteria bacterium]|nr:DNA polymerase IV [candidate division Zixibacteria bacterium]